MHYFYGFIAIVLIIMFFLLLYNETLKNEQLLTELVSRISELKGKIYCANSGHECDKVVEYKKELPMFEAEYSDLIVQYQKLVRVYKMQYAFFALSPKKTKFRAPADFEIKD